MFTYRVKVYGMISPELQNFEKSQLAFIFKCLLGVVEACVCVYTPVHFESTSQQMDMLVFPTHWNLKMNYKFCAEANIFMVEWGLSPLKQVLQTVLSADERDTALEKSYAQHLERKKKRCKLTAMWVV